MERRWFLKGLPRKFEQTKYGLEQIYTSSKINYKVVVFTPLGGEGAVEHFLVHKNSNSAEKPMPLTKEEFRTILWNNEFESTVHFVWEFLVQGTRIQVVANDNNQTTFVASAWFESEIQAEQFDDTVLREYVI